MAGSPISLGSILIFVVVWNRLFLLNGAIPHGSKSQTGVITRTSLLQVPPRRFKRRRGAWKSLPMHNKSATWTRSGSYQDIRESLFFGRQALSRRVSQANVGPRRESRGRVAQTRGRHEGV
jgi:hypothetical protein